MTRFGGYLWLGPLLGVLLVPLAPLPRPDGAVAGTIEKIVRGPVGQPVPGARVVVEGTLLGTMTNDSGFYRLANVPAGAVTVAVRSLGYQMLRQGVSVVEGQVTRLDRLLTVAVFALDEVVATGVPSFSAARSVSGLRVRAKSNGNTEEYKHLVENGWRTPRRYPLSTFSSDVDAASYANVRRFVSQGSLPPKDAVRIEEMVKYFVYDYPEPRGTHPVTVTTELGQTRRLDLEDLPPGNLVFLLDVSGSTVLGFGTGNLKDAKMEQLADKGNGMSDRSR